MKILLDECTPRIVKRRLPHYRINTVPEMGWAGTKNGALLTLAETQFDIFVTTDKNLRYQQNLKARKLAIIILPSNRVPIVESVIPQIEAILEVIKVGEVFEIPLPPTK